MTDQHNALIQCYASFEPYIVGYGNFEAVVAAVRSVAQALGHHITLSIQGSGINGSLGQGFRSIGLKIRPPKGFRLEGGDMDQESTWLVSFATDVRHLNSVPEEPHHAIFEPGIVIREAVRAGLRAVMEFGTSPGWARVAADPETRCVMIADSRGETELSRAWASVTGLSPQVVAADNIDALAYLLDVDMHHQSADTNMDLIEQMCARLQAGA